MSEFFIIGIAMGITALGYSISKEKERNLREELLKERELRKKAETAAGGKIIEIETDFVCGIREEHTQYSTNFITEHLLVKLTLGMKEKDGIKIKTEYLGDGIISHKAKCYIVGGPEE